MKERHREDRAEEIVDPDKVGEYPLDGAQHECSVGWKRVIEMDHRLQEHTARALDPQLDRGLEVDMGTGR